MIYLNSILGNKYYSGVVQIDIPVPEGWEKRKKIIPNQNARKVQAASTLFGTALGATAGTAIPIPLFGNAVGAVIGGAVGTAVGYVGGLVGTAISGEQWDTYEVPTEFGYTAIRAFCTDDVTINLGNEWGSILPSLGSITQFSQLGNEGNVVTWLAGTRASWRGNKPLTFPLTFYIFSLHRGANALNIIEPMLEFAGVGDSSGSRFNFFGIDEATVRVHGGYKVNPFQNSSSYIETSKTSQNNNATFKVHLGEQVCIDNLLLGDIQVTHSNVYVDSGVPLYVKVQANFRTVGVPTIYDIKRWYGVS